MARETFGGGIVGSEAGEVAGFFRDPAKFAIIIVTTGEALVISETLEIHHALEQLQLAAAAVVFNRAAMAGFEAADIGRMMRRGTRDTHFKHLPDLAEIAQAELKQRNRERRAIGILDRQVKSPIVLLPERRGLAGRKLAAALADQFSRMTT